MDNEKTEAEFKTPLGTASIKTRRLVDIFVTITSVLVFLMSYIIWEHKVEQREFNKLLLTAFSSLITVTKMQTCIYTLPAERREAEYNNPNSFCSRLSETKLHDVK